MPLARVPYQDGYEWLISPNQVIILITRIYGLSATEIGQRVLALVPRLQRLAKHFPDWGPFQAIEDLEMWVDSLEEREKHSARLYQEHGIDKD